MPNNISEFDTNPAEERFAAALKSIEQLKVQLAMAMTDNEALTEQNTKLHDEAAKARKEGQEFAQLNSLLTAKAHRLEQDMTALGQSHDRLKEGFEKMTRKFEETVDRLKRVKSLEKEEPVKVNG